MNASLSSKRKSIVSENSGELEQMGVQFREIDPFNLWVSATETGKMPSFTVNKLRAFLPQGKIAQLTATQQLSN